MLPELLKIGELLDGKGCAECDAQGYTLGAENPTTGEIQHLPCEHCHGTGLNVAYDGLREVVREKEICHGFCGGKGWYMSRNPRLGGDEQSKTHCGMCNGRGYNYIPRSFEGWLDGQLEGALIKAIYRLSLHTIEFLTLKKELRLLLSKEGDTRLAAARALLEALKGQA